ncbi:uncharacterized protein LOC9659037 isoform X1 [Selaginella moellendorffii]|uniref:uncharacterized protein LOC9659037 isoform X1 n=1 Tax=Selaginella moellendorffii TaxID=88036 RepID=UPI000D1C7A50|nr:uncharacterized protein LOC9659037 isoform X1 [Selaginella moellendorffii]|eukprot:XP_024525528.1 uncharacterized protein LOC9659037 isoform X1 [Selaginella moellendorffii]
MTTVAAAASFESVALTSLVLSNSNQDSSALTFHHFSNMPRASADRFPRKVISFLAPASLFFSLHCSYTLEGRRCASARLFFISLEPADKLLLVGSSTKARMTASFIHAYHYGGHVLRHRGPTIERKQAKVCCTRLLPLAAAKASFLTRVCTNVLVRSCNKVVDCTVGGSSQLLFASCCGLDWTAGNRFLPPKAAGKDLPPLCERRKTLAKAGSSSVEDDGL